MKVSKLTELRRDQLRHSGPKSAIHRLESYLIIAGSLSPMMLMVWS